MKEYFHVLRRATYDLAFEDSERRLCFFFNECERTITAQRSPKIYFHDVLAGSS